MSRIGKKVITIPAGVEVKVAPSREVTVKGPQGTLGIKLRPEIDVAVDGNEATVSAQRLRRAAPGPCVPRHDARAAREHGRRRDQGLREEARDPSASVGTRSPRARRSR